MTPPPCNPPEGATVDSDGYWAEFADIGLFCRCGGGWQLDCKLVAPIAPSPPTLMIKRAAGPTCTPPEGVTPDGDGEWISPDDGCSRCGCSEDGGMWCVGCPLVMTPPPCNPPEGATVDSDGYWAEFADIGLFCRCGGGWQLDCKLVAPIAPSPPTLMIKRAAGPTCTPPEGVTPDGDGE